MTREEKNQINLMIANMSMILTTINSAVENKQELSKAKIREAAQILKSNINIARKMVGKNGK